LKPPDLLIAASRLQRYENTAGVKLQKGGLRVSDLCDTPENPMIICCGKIQYI